MTPLVCAAIISTLHLEGDLTADGGDYAILELEVPAGTVEIQVDHTDGSTMNILDWGVWGPDGFRGWGGGLEDAAVIGVAESSRGYLPGPIAPGPGWSIVIGKAKLAQPPAHYVVDVTFRDAATLTPEPATAWAPVVLATGARWYAGDLHVHSRESGDASAEIDAIVAFARGRGIDFVALSDHNTVSQDDLLAYAQESVDDLLLLRSIEVTTYGGHGGALGAGAYVDHRVGLAGRTAAAMIAEVNAAGGLFIVNHPALDLGAACIGCAWQHADTPWDAVAAMEIQTGPYEATIGLFTPLALGLWDEQLDAGHRVTAVGGSDDHRAGVNPSATQSPIGSPTTLVYADELGEQAIIDAIRAGRVVVNLRGPDDPLVELFVVNEVGTRGMIGDTVAAGTATVEVHVVGGAGREVDVVRDGVAVDSATVETDDWTGTFSFPVDASGHRFRAELYESDLRIVVTNHVWVMFQEREGSASGCGCRVASRAWGAGAAAAFVLAALLLAVARRRRR